MRIEVFKKDDNYFYMPYSINVTEKFCDADSDQNAAKGVFMQIIGNIASNLAPDLSHPCPFVRMITFSKITTYFHNTLIIPF